MTFLGANLDSVLTAVKLADIPATPAGLPPQQRQFLDAVRETIQVREGKRGPMLDQGVTFRDLIASGIVDGPVGLNAAAVGKRPSAPSITPKTDPALSDLTPPPAATGLAVDASLNTFYLQWDAPSYTMGGGHQHTEVWAAGYSGTGPLPTFGNALLLDRVQAALYSYPAGLHRAVRFWIKHVTKAGVAQLDPTGGINGVGGATGVIGASDIDGTGLDIKDVSGTTIFSHDGGIGANAYLNINGNNVLLSAVAANALTPALFYVGEFASAPTQAQLGTSWKQNAVYKNSTDGRSYVLTGTPLGWVVYLADGQAFTLSIESSNGTVFRPGTAASTLLQARLFKNGAEVTAATPPEWFSWRRKSAIAQAPPNDDATWNNTYRSGYKQVQINVDDVYARATFFCDVISP